MLSIIIISYVISVLCSFYVLRKAHKNTRNYRFSRSEKIVGLVIVPLLPVVNIAVAAFHI